MATESEILDRYPQTEGKRLIRDERNQKVLQLREKAGVPYFTFPKLAECECIDHLFTTRAGGVSSGHLASMNFSIRMGDKSEKVSENFRRISEVLQCDMKDMVGTVQTHTTNIRKVTREDGGKGILFEQDYQDIDGLITREKGITLCAYTADCVPIFFVDPVKEVIGIAHSGWRGTAMNMAGKMVEAMQGEYGTDPKDLIAGIGPSICQKCYEVDETVAEAFRTLLGDDREERRKIELSGTYPMSSEKGLRSVVMPGRADGKYQLDLWLANLILLIRAGVLIDRIDVTDICTACNPEILFSHRASHGKRGNLGGMIRLR